MKLPKLSGTRVQIPAWHDMWMRGDRYGEIIQSFRHPLMKQRRLSNPIVHIKMDKSGKMIRIPLDDCEVL